MALQLTSAAFREGAEIPKLFTCDARDLSPPLAWTDPPKAARSFAIVCHDPDAPSGTWYHWAIFDLPAQYDHLPQGHNPDSTSPPQAINDFGRHGYGGPCPPRGRGVHRYVFTIYAVTVDRLNLAPSAHCADVERAARARLTASAQLTGVYSR